MRTVHAAVGNQGAWEPRAPHQTASRAPATAASSRHPPSGPPPAASCQGTQRPWHSSGSPPAQAKARGVRRRPSGIAPPVPSAWQRCRASSTARPPLPCRPRARCLTVSFEMWMRPCAPPTSTKAPYSSTETWRFGGRGHFAGQVEAPRTHNTHRLHVRAAPLRMPSPHRASFTALLTTVPCSTSPSLYCSTEPLAGAADCGSAAATRTDGLLPLKAACLLRACRESA